MPNSQQIPENSADLDAEIGSLELTNGKSQKPQSGEGNQGRGTVHTALHELTF